MIKISKPSGIFSKLKNIFIDNESSAITNDNPQLNSIVPNSNNEDILPKATDKINDVDDTADLSPFSTPKPTPIIDDVSSDSEPLVSTYEPKKKLEINEEKEACKDCHTISIQSSNDVCFSKLDTKGNTYYTTGKRKVLFKVEKYKFDYPVPKTTTLYYYPNLPIIQSLELTKNIKHDNTKTTTIICNNQSVVIPIEFDYEEITFKPYVSYSVALYNQKPPIIFDPAKGDFDINNLDIYTLENDALFLTPFTMCFSSPAKNFEPSDFLVELSVTDPLGGKVSPVCEFDSYYLYEIELEIKLSLSPLIDLSSINIETLNVLNAKLNKPSGNTLFTQGELDFVTSIDYSGLTNLDYNIFDYLLNLRILNISNTNASVNANSNFIHLNNLIRLTTLIAQNNHFTDYSAFSLLTNLVNTLTSIDIKNTNTKSFNALALTGDITPLTMFKNLEFLDLSYNGISTLPPEISNLTKLNYLDLSSNTISTLPPQIGNLFNLNTLDLANNNLTTLPPEIGSLFNLNTLDLAGNNLTTLPPEIGSLSNLTTLNLNGNSIQDLSPLFNLDNLENLSIEGNPVDPSTIENLPVIRLDLSNSNLDNQYITNLKVSDRLQTLIISGNQISDLSPLGKYNLNILALNQKYYYNLPEADLGSTITIDLETFLKDVDGDVPCIEYISNGGVCGPIESCDCLSITWSNITESIEAYFDFANVTDTFTGRVFVELSPAPIS